jgi:hypothetical protein
MLIQESFEDVTTQYGGSMRIFTFHPQIPNYPKAKFPGVVVFSEIYQGEFDDCKTGNKHNCFWFQVATSSQPFIHVAPTDDTQ